MWTRSVGWPAAVAATLLSSACGAETAQTQPSRSATSTPLPTQASVTPPTTVVAPAIPASKNWFDLAVGDCIAKIPQLDLGEVTASVVDCATAHQAEVYLRVPVEVDAAVADVADQKCDAGVVNYTGRGPGDSPFVVTYLIDSNQDRTVADPLPSTVICLLQTADRHPLTASAHR